MSTNELETARRARIAATPTVQDAITTAGAEIPNAMFPDRWALDVVDAVLDAEAAPVTAAGPAVTNVSTDAEFDEWIEDADEHFYFVTDATDRGYVLFCTEDGDWYATRPADDDDEREDGTYPGGVTVDIDTLTRPITIQTVAVTR